MGTDWGLAGLIPPLFGYPTMEELIMKTISPRGREMEKVDEGNRKLALEGQEQSWKTQGLTEMLRSNYTTDNLIALRPQFLGTGIEGSIDKAIEGQMGLEAARKVMGGGQPQQGQQGASQPATGGIPQGVSQGPSLPQPTQGAIQQPQIPQQQQQQPNQQVPGAPQQPNYTLPADQFSPQEQRNIADLVGFATQPLAPTPMMGAGQGSQVAPAPQGPSQQQQVPQGAPQGGRQFQLSSPQQPVGLSPNEATAMSLVTGKPEYQKAFRETAGGGLVPNIEPTAGAAFTNPGQGVPAGMYGLQSMGGGADINPNMGLKSVGDIGTIAQRSAGAQHEQAGTVERLAAADANVELGKVRQEMAKLQQQKQVTEVDRQTYWGLRNQEANLELQLGTATAPLKVQEQQAQTGTAQQKEQAAGTQAALGQAEAPLQLQQQGYNTQRAGNQAQASQQLPAQSTAKTKQMQAGANVAKTKEQWAAPQEQATYTGKVANIVAPRSGQQQGGSDINTLAQMLGPNEGGQGTTQQPTNAPQQQGQPPAAPAQTQYRVPPPTWLNQSVSQLPSPAQITGQPQQQPTGPQNPEQWNQERNHLWSQTQGLPEQERASMLKDYDTKAGATQQGWVDYGMKKGWFGKGTKTVKKSSASAGKGIAKAAKPSRGTPVTKNAQQDPMREFLTRMFPGW